MLAWPSQAEKMQLALESCFADACAYLPSDSASDDEWPSIGNFAVSGTALSFVLGIGSHYETITVPASSDSFPIVSGSGSWGAYSVVLSSEGILELVALISELAISPPVQAISSSAGRARGFWLRLCARCVNLKASGLQSLRVFDGQVSNGHTLANGPHFVLKDDVVVRPGNNMQFAEPDDIENGFELDAVPGAGLGRMPCVCAETAGGNPMLAGPDGHARFFNDTCYDLEPNTDTGVLQIHVKCLACCTCAMYEELVKRLSILADSVRNSRSAFRSDLQAYESAVKKFNARLDVPASSDVRMSLTGMPIGRNLSPKINNTKVSGKMSRCAFTAIVRNATYFEVLASIVSMSGTDSIVESSAAWSLEDGTPQSETSNFKLTGKTYSIFPGRSLVLTFESVKNKWVSSVSTGGFTGSVGVNLSYKDAKGGVHALGFLNKTVSV